MDTPSQIVFDNIKHNSILLWNVGGYHPNYIQKKVDRIMNIENDEGNAGFIVAMFDPANQSKLKKFLSIDALNYLKEWDDS